MVYSKLTNQVETSAQSSKRVSKVDTFLIHHQAGTNDDAVIAAMVNGTKGVSANYTISNEGRITCVVPEERRAWTSGSSYDDGRGAAWDHRSITVEIENESAAPDWNISDKALQAAANLLNDLRSRYTIKNVLGHRDLWDRFGASYATFCPGPDTVASIVALSQAKPEQEEELSLMSQPHYICFVADPKNRHYAIISTEIEGGFKRTQTLAVAQAYSTISADGAPVYCKTLKIFEDTLALAATLYAEAQKSRSVVNVTLPESLSIPTAAQIAEAVNDDAAVRLKS